MIYPPLVDPFSGVLPFVRVVEERSFTGAARRLGVTTAAVSKAVARLEADLGVVLVSRSSRRVAPTPEGRLFFERARAAVDAVLGGRDLVHQSRNIADGPVRVSLSPILGPPVVGGLESFTTRYPRVELELAVTDHVTRLLEDDVDVAVRIGALPDSRLISRRLAQPRWVTVASPAYLARAGRPERPRDLSSHDCLLYRTPRGTDQMWSFPDAGDLALPCRWRSDNGQLLLEAAVAGLGVAQVFDFMVGDHLHAGDLVTVLEDFATPGPPIHALTLPGRQRSATVRPFLDYLSERFTALSG